MLWKNLVVYEFLIVCGPKCLWTECRHKYQINFQVYMARSFLSHNRISPSLYIYRKWIDIDTQDIKNMEIFRQNLGFENWKWAMKMGTTMARMSMKVKLLISQTDEVYWTYPFDNHKCLVCVSILLPAVQCKGIQVLYGSGGGHFTTRNRLQAFH